MRFSKLVKFPWFKSVFLPTIQQDGHSFFPASCEVTANGMWAIRLHDSPFIIKQPEKTAPESQPCLHLTPVPNTIRNADALTFHRITHSTFNPRPYLNYRKGSLENPDEFSWFHFQIILQSLITETCTAGMLCSFFFSLLFFFFSFFFKPFCKMCEDWFVVFKSHPEKEITRDYLNSE